MATQTELLERQEAATDLLEAQNATLALILNGAADVTVQTEAGPIPTIRGLYEEIRQRAGYRRWEIHYSVEALTRYENKLEALLRDINTRPVYLQDLLAGSFFRLAKAPSGGPIVLTLKVGTVATYTITFATNSLNGVVTGTAGVQTIPIGTTWELTLNGPSLAATGFHCAVYGLAEAPAA